MPSFNHFLRAASFRPNPLRQVPAARRTAFVALLAAGAIAAGSAVAQTAHFAGIDTVTLTNLIMGPGIAVDSSGDLFVPDLVGNQIYETKAAGPTVSVSTNHVSTPYLALDSSNNIYALTSSLTVIKIPSNGAGGYGAPVTLPATGLKDPTGIAVDSSGNVFIADLQLQQILKLSYSAGYYTQSVFFSFSFDSGGQLAIDSANNLYLANASAGEILQISPAAVVSNVVSLSNYPPESQSTLSVAVDSGGNLAVSSGGLLYYFAYNGGAYTPTLLNSISAAFKGLAFDPAGNIYASESTSKILYQTAMTGNLGSVNVGTTSQTSTLVFVFDTTGSLNATPVEALTQGQGGLDVAATGGTCTGGTSHPANSVCTVTATLTPAYAGLRSGAIVLYGSAGAPVATGFVYGVGIGPQIAFPLAQTTFPVGGDEEVLGVALDGARNMFLTLQGSSNELIEATLSGGSYTLASTPIATNLSSPNGVRVDGAGNVYVADYDHSRIVKEVLSAGTYSQVSISSGLSEPTDLAVDQQGNVFVADLGLDTIAEEPLVNGAFGTYIPIGSGLSSPSGITIDAAGNLYVVDSGNNRIVKETLTNGVYVQSDIIDNLLVPAQIAIDAAGNLYITQDANLTVVKETLSGGTYVQSTLPFTGLSNPRGIAIDGTGNLYVADEYTGNVYLGLATRPQPLTFASTTYNTQSSDSPQSIAVSNNGNAPLLFTATGSGTNPKTVANFPFDSSTTCPFGTTSGSGSVAAGSVCSFAFDFIPQGVGPISGHSTLTTNMLGSNLYNLNLSGNATPASQTLTFTAPATLAYIPGETLALNGTASSGLAVSYNLSGPASISGNTLTITGTGTINLLARQNGNRDYAPAPSVSQMIVVTAAPVTNTSFSDTAVGSYATAVPVTVLITTAGTAANIAVLTKGVAGLDFQDGGGGTCSTATAYVEGSTCTVNVVFGPKYSGARYGGVVLTDANNNVLGNTYLQGRGLGPQLTFSTGAGAPSTTLLAASPSLGGISQVAVDGSGNLFIAGSSPSGIGELPAANNYGTALRTIGGGFSNPIAVAVDGSGNLFVLDDGTNTITEIRAAGDYSSPPIALGAAISSAPAIAVDGNGNLFVTDLADGTIEEVSAANNYSSATVLVSNLDGPFGIAVDSNDNLFVAAYDGGIVQEFTAAGSYSTPITLASGFGRPRDVAVDGNGNVFVADAISGEVSEILAAGNYGAPPMPVYQAPGAFVMGVAVDASGNAFVPFSHFDEANDGELVELTLATPPTLTFPTTATGVASAPMTVDLINNGNEPLTLPVPAMGTDPETGANFALETNADTTCQIANAGGTTGTLLADTECVLSYTFNPAQTGSITSNSVLIDNALNVPAAMQSITLTGFATQGTQSAQSITFPQPTQTTYPGTATLTATASPSGLPVSYTVVSGPATVSGSTLTYTNDGTVIVEASQSGDAKYSAAPNQFVTIDVSLAQSAINWSPSTLKIYTGTPLGASVLDATDSVPSTITYSARLLPSATPQAVDASTVLTPQGSYNLTALITPQDTVNYAITTDTFLFTVQNMNAFVGNALGTVFSFYNNGTQQSAPTAGGGIGAAVDSSGYVWSINNGGAGLSKFTDAGIFSASYSSVGGINAATALAIDGNSTIWIANGDGTVSALNNDGTAAASTTMAKAYNLSAPASIAVDSAGSLWLSNSGNNTVTEIIGAAAPITAPAVDAVIDTTMGTRP